LAFAPYYKDVRYPRWLILAALLPLVLTSACNRGAHPPQLNIPAPDFSVSDGTNSIRLDNYRGQAVLVNFWASWCEPCLEELPSLEQLHHDMPNMPILAVSIDEDPEAYSSFIVRHHMDFTMVRDPSQSAAKLFHTDMWPETYAIDRNGVIRRKFVGPQDWTSPEIQSFLKNL
jgi:cytochrome c biogenesis protein CcmG, thiol:disulfide interchange protein DsbE